MKKTATILLLSISISAISCASASRANMRYGYTPRELDDYFEKHKDYKPVWYSPKNVKPYNMIPSAPAEGNLPDLDDNKILDLLMDLSPSDDVFFRNEIMRRLKSAQEEKTYAELLEIAKNKIKNSSNTTAITDKGMLTLYSGKNGKTEYIPYGAPDSYTFTEKSASIKTLKNTIITYQFWNNAIVVEKENRAAIFYANIAKELKEKDSNNNAWFSVSINTVDGVYLRKVNTDKADISYNFRFPEILKVKSISSFLIYYTEKDEELIKKISAESLDKVKSNCESITGIKFRGTCAIVIPPDMASYEKMYTSNGYQMRFLPDSFERMGAIYLWPLSAGRYETVTGSNYFFSTEMYEILAHEYVHVLLDQESGYRNFFPRWLTEGLAVYIQTNVSDDERVYYTRFFGIMSRINCFVDWDTLTSHQDLQRGENSMMYAQSYAFVSYLIAKFGMDKLIKYSRTFRITPTNYHQKESYLEQYKRTFNETFGVSFEDAVKESRIGTVSAE